MRKIILLSSLLFLLIVSCQKDFIVKDITDKTIIVNAPANNLVTSSNSITFWWEELDGAEKYNVQVVKPDFANIAQLIADTNVTGTKLNLSLNPGTYQWRIKGVNAGGSTAFQTYTLKIDSTSNLTNQLVVPISPLSGYVTNNKAISFSWNSLSSATNYSIEISLNGSVINYSTTTNTNYAYTFTLTSAANYTCSWRVRALNSNSISQYNTPQTFTIDLLSPSVSIPTLPTSNSTVTDTTELKWNRIGVPDAQYDSLFIYSDSLITLARKTIVTATKIKINAIDTSFPLQAGSSSLTPVPYWWRLKTIDNAGNTSGFSNALKFKLVQ